MDSTPIMAVGRWRDNAALIADVARLSPGYLSGRVLDATYGKGTFWNDYKPDDLWTNDLYVPDATYSIDYRSLPESWTEHFDAVVFDPDYKLNGTPALGEFDDRYGIAENKNREQRLNDIVAGAIECYRVTRRWLLVKCMDQVEGGRMRWQTDLVTRAIDDAGGRKVERLDLLGGGRPQPARTRKCQRCDGFGDLTVYHPDDEVPETQTCPDCEGGRIASAQQHAYGRGSTLLIFKKG